MRVLPRYDLIYTDYKLLTDILRFLILERGIAPVIGRSLSARPNVSAVGLRVVAAIASNMAFTNPGMSSVVSGQEGRC